MLTVCGTSQACEYECFVYAESLTSFSVSWVNNMFQCILIVEPQPLYCVLYPSLCRMSQGCPMKVTQGYLVCISVIMAWQLSHLPEVRSGLPLLHQLVDRNNATHSSIACENAVVSHIIQHLVRWRGTTQNLLRRLSLAHCLFLLSLLPVEPISYDLIMVLFTEIVCPERWSSKSLYS